MEVETQANCTELDVEVERDEQLEALQSAYRQGQLLLQGDASQMSKTELKNAVASLSDLTVPYTEQITTTLPDAFEAVHSIVSSLTKSLEDHLPLVLPGTVDHLITKYGALSEDDRLLLLEQSQAFLVNMAQGAFDVVTQEPLVDSHRLADVFALFVSQLHASTKSDSWGSICLLHGKLSRMSTADIARLFNLCLRAKPAVFPLVFAPHADDRYLGAAVAEARRVHQISQRVLRDIAGDAGSCVNDLLLAAVLHMSTKRQFTSGASGSPGTLPSIPFINDPGTSTPSQAPAVLSSTRQSAAVAPRVGNDSNEGMNQDVGSSSGVSAERKPLSPGKSPNKAPKATHQDSPSLVTSRKKTTLPSDRLADTYRSSKRPRRSLFADKYPE